MNKGKFKMEMELQEKLLQERSKESRKINKSFMADTKSNEVLIIILKAHLYIERELIKTLTETIIDEKVLNNTTFRQKLDLANSMGLIDGFYGTLGKVNSIRNGYAHEVDYVFNEKIFEDLLSTLPKEEKDDYLSEYDIWKALFYDGTIPELNFKLQLLLNNIWFSVVSCRAFARQAIELRLREKEVEQLSKYLQSERVDDIC